MVWQPATSRTSSTGRTVVTDYGTNVITPSAEAVKLWQVDYNASGTPTGARSTTSYAAGRLYKTVVKDENWVSDRAGTVEEYRDFDDRVVLKRIWETESKKLETYYVYDDFGDLCYVVPPAVTAGSFTESAAAFTNYIYAYRYDSRRRLKEKKIPGKGWEWIVYNQNDLPIMTQDALQRTKNPKEWSYTKYDAFGRVVQTGTLTAAHATQSAAQTAADNHARPGNRDWEQRRVNAAEYSNVSFPVANLKRLTVSYYDNYNKFMGSVDTVQLAPRAISRSTKVHSLLTGSRVYTDSGTDSLLTVYYYDERGRTIQTASRNHLGGKDIVTNTYLFSGEVETSKREHWKSLTTSQPMTVLTTNKYDHVGRLVETKKRVGSHAEVTQSQLAYNEIGQLMEKKLHVSGSSAVQEVAYGYNERGWTTSINNPSSVTDKRRFGMNLHYANNPQAYNGNIGSVQWNTKVTSSQTQTPLQTYTYTYDKLNRLKKAAYSGATNKTGRYNEELAYDVMGNIDTLRRTNGDTGWYNHFKYSYTGNKLNSVTDIGTANRDNSFIYDVNGNVTKNDRLGITDIEYNYLNLPKKFVKGTQQLVYTYDATGRKLKKALGNAVTDYVDGIQYKNGVLEFIQTEEGRILPNGSSFVYEYFLKDHLGNTRAIVDHTGKVSQIQDYYAFGMEMNTGSGLNSASNHYKYNGKEKQVELGLDQLDYGARFYDAEIGRWNVVDPAADYYPEVSPYAYVLNDPLSYTDENGEIPGPVGAVIGIAADYIQQVGINYFIGGHDLKSSLTSEISIPSLVVSGVSGAFTGGISSLTNTLTSKVGQKALTKIIDVGIDAMVSTVGKEAVNYAEGKDIDVWKSLTGGLLEAGIGKLIPLKYVDKLEKKLLRKMNVSANKAEKYKRRMANDSHRNKKTQKRNQTKFKEYSGQNRSYTRAYMGVRTVNEAYKIGGAEALQRLNLYISSPSPIPGIEVGTPEILK
nr:RHS repeat-associated core domain-containing protein [Sphingobacterium haloxyli]